MIQSNSSYAKFKQVYYGVEGAHNILGLRDPLKSPLLIALGNAAKRTLSKPVCKKEPIKPWHLQKLVKLFGGNNASFLDLRLLTMCFVGFAGFFRFSELINIRRNDIIFYGKYLKIFIERSKTDKYRKGTWIFIAKTCRETCPVSTLRKYLKGLKLSPSSNDYIFKAFCYRKKNEYTPKKKHTKKPLSYSQTREIVLEASEKIGLPQNKFGLHTLRSGGATSAANIGVKDSLFKKHGHWESEKNKRWIYKTQYTRISTCFCQSRHLSRTTFNKFNTLLCPLFGYLYFAAIHKDMPKKPLSILFCSRSFLQN